MSDGFLGRWARRKRDVRLSERAEAPPTEAETAEAGAVPGEAVIPDAAAAEAERDLLADLPSLEDLTAETDLTPFLRAGVPTFLRNAALRKMWSVDPAIRDFVSEAREYAYDWNTPGGVPGLGPLLPGDDVKAMLSRLFNRDPSEAAEPERAVPETEPGEPATEPEPVPVPPRALERPDPQAGFASEAAVPLPPLAPANSPKQSPATSAKPVAAQRLRRHGGAMPT